MKKRIAFIAFILVLVLFACPLSVGAYSQSSWHVDIVLEKEWENFPDDVIYRASTRVDKDIERLMYANEIYITDIYVYFNETWQGRDIDFAAYLDANYYDRSDKTEDSIVLVSSGDRTEIYLRGNAAELFSDEQLEQLRTRFERRARLRTPGAVTRAAKRFSRDCVRMLIRDKRRAEFAELSTPERYVKYFLSQGLPVTLGVVLGPLIGAVLTLSKVRRFSNRRRIDRIGRYSKVN